MWDLGYDERATLGMIVERSEHAVLDGETLCRLHERGLIDLSMEGWEVTPLGRVVSELVEPLD